MIFEDFFENAGYGHVGRWPGHCCGEDAAVRGAGGEPEPGHDRGLIMVEPLAARKLDKGADVAAEKPLFFIASLLRHAPGNANAFADESQKIDRAVFAEQVCLHDKRPAQLLADGDAPQQQLILAQRCFYCNGAIVLGVGHATRSPKAEVRRPKSEMTRSVWSAWSLLPLSII